MNFSTIINAFANPNNSNEHIIVSTARLPRALIATAVGAALAVSGVIMQCLTKNPLASPGLLGINAGASFFVVLGVAVFNIQSIQTLIWIGFLGAAVSGIIISIVAFIGNDRLNPIKITLAGVAISALFSSLTQGILVLNEASLDQVVFWLAGSVANRNLSLFWMVLPYMLLAMIVAILFANRLNILVLGDDIAKSLGQNTVLVKVMLVSIVIVLAGSAVSLAGPIGFVGIIVPHIVRYYIGVDYRWVIPYSAVLGAILLLGADIASRFIIMPKEIPLGVMTAIIGAPFFFYIVRKRIL